MKKFFGAVGLSALLFLLSFFAAACGANGDSSSSSPASSVARFTLMSFNIRTVGDVGTYAWDNRKDNVASYLAGQDADVICMQEGTTAQYDYIEEGIKEKYQVVHYERQGAGSEGLAVAFDKEKFELQSSTRFWLSETPGEMSLGWGARYYRICVNVLLKDRTTGGFLDVYDVHLDHESEEARINGLGLILDRVAQKQYPAFVAGDFNDVTDSPCYDRIAEKMWDCHRCAIETDDGTTWHNWGSIADDANSPIDFCFVSEEITPLTFRICRDRTAENLFYSDHYAVKTTVEIGR